MDDLDPHMVFGMSWGDFLHRHRRTISRCPFELSDPFVVLCRFERAVGLKDDHGPAAFEFMFARCEAIAAFISAFSRRNIAPEVLVHIRSGMGYGGNFGGYPQKLSNAVRENPGGLPRFLFYDDMGCDRRFGDYLGLVERYEQIQEWVYEEEGDHLRVARLIAHEAQMQPFHEAGPIETPTSLNYLETAESGMTRRRTRDDHLRILKLFIEGSCYFVYMSLFFEVLRCELDDPSVLHDALQSDCIDRIGNRSHGPAVEGNGGAAIYPQLMEILMTVESERIKSYLRDTFPELAKICDDTPCSQFIQNAETWYEKQLRYEKRIERVNVVADTVPTPKSHKGAQH
jgi:hypothetical protein